MIIVVAAMLSGLRNVLLVVLFFLSLVTGNFGASQAQFISCPISLSPAGQPFWIRDRAIYQCRVDSADTLEWRVYNATEYLLGSSTYGPGTSVGTIKSFGIDFTTNLTSTGSPIVSDIAFDVKYYRTAGNICGELNFASLRFHLKRKI
ncbi:PREDICTED: uncharacterized protein LOC109593051 [Amphimedon queenslandica]|uniref:Uncharacterized protein n=1 Tax=Amphimedon queenslandica TaxID=400682 RepID=A0AAN0K3X0_AMPQE|nr:PREDICTED: uncharacterized protein LOC109593051 [Amphimedon queenslandica]|eukprot:XP_019863869.1 PREDICTED: uncharacterized protein LOC109593051 [Amphimedon queenslandica]